MIYVGVSYSNKRNDEVRIRPDHKGRESPRFASIIAASLVSLRGPQSTSDDIFIESLSGADTETIEWRQTARSREH